MAIESRIEELRHRADRVVILFFLFLRKIRLPGFKGVGLYDVLRFFIRAMGNRAFTQAASDMAYRFFFSLFPALIFILTMIPMLNIPELDSDTVMSFFRTFTPPESLGFVQNVVDEFFEGKYFGLLSFNFALTLFSALGGIRAMMRAFSKDDLALKRRGFFRANGLALMIFLVLLVMLIIVLIVFIAGEYAIHYLDNFEMIRETYVGWMIQVFRWIVLLLALFFTISLLYYLVPDTHTRFDFFSPGAILSGVLTLSAIIAFRYFITQFDQLNKVYGSLSAIMILMVWFYWLSIVLLIGFELNAAIDLAKLSRKMRLRDLGVKTEGLSRRQRRKKLKELELLKMLMGKKNQNNKLG